MTIQELVEFEQMLKKCGPNSPGAENLIGPEPTEAQMLYYKEVSEKIRAGETVDLSMENE